MIKVDKKKSKVKFFKGSHPYYEEVDAHLFEVNGEQFAFNPKNNGSDMEFTHIRSGLSFNGNFSRKISKVEESFNTRVKALGETKFWDTVKNSRDLQENIRLSERKVSINHEKLKVIKELTRDTGHTFYIDNLILAVSGVVAFDIVKTDEQLKRRFPHDYTDGVSMREFITKQFGKIAAEKVDFLLQN